MVLKSRTEVHIYDDEIRELSWCQICCPWWHRRLSLRQPPVPPATTKLAPWQFSVDGYLAQGEKRSTRLSLTGIYVCYVSIFFIVLETTYLRFKISNYISMVSIDKDHFKYELSLMLVRLYKGIINRESRNTKSISAALNLMPGAPFTNMD